jgi:hypothetical protein
MQREWWGKNLVEKLFVFLNSVPDRMFVTITKVVDMSGHHYLPAQEQWLSKL